MAATLTWKILHTKRDLSSGKISEVAWELKGVDSGDNTNTHETTGTTATDGDVTTAYADLKESDVIKWVKDDLGSTKVSELEAEATSGVIQNLGVPW